jgi:hypothetical protein
MKRPPRIYELLGKVSDGTFLNVKEFLELETYISELEMDKQSKPQSLQIPL